MEKNYKFNRQKNDYILTDLLPYEKGNHYTHRYFYEYLQTNKKILNKLLIEVSKEGKFFDSKWHSNPLKFKISKKGEGFREISLINPLGLVESIQFINLFENDIINVIQNKIDFSSRKPRRTNSLTYKKTNNKTVYYTDNPNTKQQLLISLESSGTYFKHSPFKSITQLRNSKRFTYSRDKFNLLLTLDIQNCFPSIYTHSFKWLISNKTYDSKSLKNANSLYSNIDAFLQNINGSITNGIIVGPEISRLLVEFLFVHLDEILIQLLAERNLHIHRDYIIYRFVDDFYICTNYKGAQTVIKEEISHLLNKFQLKINESKVTNFGKEDILNTWYFEVSPIISMIEKIFNNKLAISENRVDSVISNLEINEEFKKALLEVATTINVTSSDKRYKSKTKIKYIDLRNKVNSVIKNTSDSSLVCSYILSTILKKIEDREQQSFVINMEYNELITFILFIYAKNVSYTSTQKIIRTFSLLIDKEIPGIKEMLERNFERFEEDIFNKFPNDWIDLLLFFANYQINISHNLIEKITNKFINEENPLNLAALCLLAESEFINSIKIVKTVNTIIKNKLEIMNWKDLFQDELSWWIFIFLSYPKINKNLKKEINSKLKDVKLKLKDDPSDKAKKFVLDFLLTNKEHFIEWNFTKENYYKNYYFFTKDRTVFNPDIMDQISISR